MICQEHKYNINIFHLHLSLFWPLQHFAKSLLGNERAAQLLQWQFWSYFSIHNYLSLIKWDADILNLAWLLQRVKSNAPNTQVNCLTNHRWLTGLMAPKHICGFRQDYVHHSGSVRVQEKLFSFLLCTFHIQLSCDDYMSSLKPKC